MIGLQFQLLDRHGNTVTLSLGFFNKTIDLWPVNLIGYCTVDNFDGLVNLVETRMTNVKMMRTRS